MKHSDFTFLPALLLTIAFFGIPLLIFRAVPEKAEPQSGTSRFTIMTKEYPKDLEYWENVGNPRLFVSSSNSGYTGLLQKKEPLNESLPVSLDKLSIMDRKLARHSKVPDMRNLSAFPVEIYRETIPPPTPVLLRQPRFILNREKTISGIDCSVPVSGTQPEGSTILSIKQTDSAYPPSIQVLQSCGIPSFDLAARTALSLPAIRQKELRGTVVVEWPSVQEKKK